VALILVDANLLIYATISSFSQHRAAREWLDRQLNGSTRVGLPWSSVLAVMRVVTNPRALARPLSTADAWGQVTGWLGCDPAWIPLPTEQHASILGRLLELPGVRANLVHDADLAALAIEHGLILYSTDGDFGRFPGLRWQDPLAG
jgi:toxin-antitoxin system PIN domain toxin